MTTLKRALLATLIAVLAACSSSAAASVPPASGQPSPSAAPSSAPVGQPVTTPEEAAQAVIALDPRFKGSGPKNPDVIGACCFYQVASTADGFRVTIELGWGDCPSGCINHHQWSYSVGRDGSTKLLSESGDPVPSGGPGGGGAGDY